MGIWLCLAAVTQGAFASGERQSERQLLGLSLRVVTVRVFELGEVLWQISSRNQIKMSQMVIQRLGR